MIVMSILIFFFLLFRHFRRNSANFSAKCLFGKVAFRQNGFSAKWVSAKCRASIENAPSDERVPISVRNSDGICDFKDVLKEVL